MTQDPSPGLRFAAVDALEAHPGTAAADTLEAAYTDSSAAVRQRAMEVLPHVDPVRGLRLLLRGLQDEDSWLRESAATQLRLKGDRRDVPYLIAALGDSDPAVSNLAMGTLRKQTGQPFYASLLAPPARLRAARAQWRHWWERNKAKYQPAGFISLAPERPTRTDPAPDFNLQDLGGKPVRLGSQRGHLTLLNFWGTWCTPCQQEVPDLVRLDADYAPKNSTLLVSPSASPAPHRWPTGAARTASRIPRPSPRTQFSTPTAMSTRSPSPSSLTSRGASGTAGTARATTTPSAPPSRASWPSRGPDRLRRHWPRCGTIFWVKLI